MQKTGKRQMLSDFIFHFKLGSGSFGNVYYATKVAGDNQQPYAIKVCKKDLLHLPASLREISTLRLLNRSSFSVKMYFAFQTERATFICMEFIQGGRLRDLIKDQNIIFNIDAILFYLAELVCALEELENKNIVHRDIKSDNILLDQYGHIRLADFGTSILLQKGQLATESVTAPVYTVSCSFSLLFPVFFIGLHGFTGFTNISESIKYILYPLLIK